MGGGGSIMFFVGLAIGFVVGGVFGVLAMALFTLSRDDEGFDQWYRG